MKISPTYSYKYSRSQKRRKTKKTENFLLSFANEIKTFLSFCYLTERKNGKKRKEIIEKCIFYANNFFIYLKSVVKLFFRDFFKIKIPETERKISKILWGKFYWIPWTHNFKVQKLFRRNEIPSLHSESKNHKIIPIRTLLFLIEGHFHY